jgi:ribosomal-protein-alanine N-acetyltransferase
LLRVCFHQTERLIVRSFQDRDSNHFFLLLTHPLAKSYLRASQFCTHPHLVRQFLEQMSSEGDTFNSWLLYSIFDSNDRQLIGGCGLKLDSNHICAEIFYLLFPEYWGKGLIVEACRFLLDDALYQYRLKNVYALIIPENIRAQRVATKLGFRYVEKINLSRYGQKSKVQKWRLNLI